MGIEKENSSSTAPKTPNIENINVKRDSDFALCSGVDEDEAHEHAM